jgi:hypothetical protein
MLARHAAELPERFLKTLGVKRRGQLALRLRDVGALAGRRGDQDYLRRAIPNRALAYRNGFEVPDQDRASIPLRSVQ